MVKREFLLYKNAASIWRRGEVTVAANHLRADSKVRFAKAKSGRIIVGLDQAWVNFFLGVL